jgi:prepilin-type N-terminal cleavage/methylation domain-containing protein
VSNLLKKDKGFTLIEIVLVLAIAGLLLVIVFLAVSGAQKSRRDSQRKNDASAFAAALEQYASNNAGQYPTAKAGLAANYFSRKDPSTGAAYSIVTKAPTSAGQIEYQPGSLCPLSVTGGAKAVGASYAVTVYTEQGSGYCVDNH